MATIELRKKLQRITGKVINSLRLCASAPLRLCVSAFSAINLLIQIMTKFSFRHQRKKNLLAFQFDWVTRSTTFIGGNGEAGIQTDVPVV